MFLDFNEFSLQNLDSCMSAKKSSFFKKRSFLGAAGILTLKRKKNVMAALLLRIFFRERRKKAGILKMCAQLNDLSDDKLRNKRRHPFSLPFSQIFHICNNATKLKPGLREKTSLKKKSFAI